MINILNNAILKAAAGTNSSDAKLIHTIAINILKVKRNNSRSRKNKALIIEAIALMEA